jgi:hypothetical protein
MKIYHLYVWNRQVSVRADISITDLEGINHTSNTFSGEQWVFSLPANKAKSPRHDYILDLLFWPIHQLFYSGREK